MKRIVVAIGAREDQHTEFHIHMLAVLLLWGSACRATRHLLLADMLGWLGFGPFVGVLSADGKSHARGPHSRRPPGPRAGRATVQVAADPCTQTDSGAISVQKCSSPADCRVCSGQLVASGHHRRA